MDKQNEFIDKISKIKNEYYAQNKKNILFKSAQKNDCASSIKSNLELDLLMRNTMFVIKESNHVFLDYTIFKNFVSEDIYEDVINYFMNLILNTIHKHNVVIVHINLSTFSSSACHRYKKIIEMFLTKCLHHETEFVKKLKLLHIYNTPNLFENIISLLKHFIDPGVKDKIVYYNKTESNELLKSLHNL